MMVMVIQTNNVPCLEIVRMQSFGWEETLENLE